MAQHADFNLTHKNIVPTDFLLFNQPQFPQLLKMMKSNAGATEVQCTLNLSDACGTAVF